MSDNNELVNMLRTVIQEELKPVHQELQQVNTRLDTLETGQQELRQGQANLEAGQAAIEAAVNDLRTINRQTHKKIFTHLDAIWNDIKRIENRLKTQEEKNYSRL